MSAAKDKNLTVLPAPEKGFSVAARSLWEHNSVRGAALPIVLCSLDATCPQWAELPLAENDPSRRISGLSSSIELTAQFLKIPKQGFQRP